MLYLYYNAGVLDIVEDRKDALGMGFVDDVVYGVKGYQDKGNAKKLRKIMEKAEEWRRKHGVQFEPSKYVLVHFTRNHRRSTKAVLTLQEGTTIKPSTEAKYLGVIFDQQLRFKGHLQHAVKKGTNAALALSSIANGNWGTPHKLVKQLYQAVIAPRTDYAAVIWHRPKADESAANSMQAQKLTTVQRIAMKTILGCYRTTPTIAMELESGLPPPWIRLQIRVLSSFTRMQSLAPSHPILELINDGLRTRTSNVIHRSVIENALQQFPITATKINTVLPFTQPPWVPMDNTQTHDGTDQTKQALKEKQKRLQEIKKTANEQWNHQWMSDKRQPATHLRRIITKDGNQYGPALYNKIPSRNLCAKTIQLRTGHCGLNKYLCRVGIIDSPDCECGGGQETVEHFLLECPRYREQRRMLRNKVGGGGMRVDVLLGNWKTIVEHTADFITNTGRLD